MKLSSFLFLYLLLVLLLFDTTESTSKQPSYRFHPRNVETSGTGTSEIQGIGSIPTTSAGHNQVANPGPEIAENMSVFGHHFGSHPFLLNFAQQQNQGFVSNQTELTERRNALEKWLNNIGQQNNFDIEENADKLICKICRKKLKPYKKSRIDDHLKTDKHRKFENINVEKLKNDLISENKNYIVPIGDKLKCTLCNSEISEKWKIVVLRHIQTKKHQENFKKAKHEENKKKQEVELAPLPESLPYPEYAYETFDFYDYGYHSGYGDQTFYQPVNFSGNPPEFSFHHNPSEEEYQRQLEQAKFESTQYIQPHFQHRGPIIRGFLII
uniref:Uncharacterized protein n=1 Tax=Meloidogyne enterolobii TaxID=390850 RepID=A0A6V7WK03_MELEN|nr:unnamed protein product [Meloidogyne enterolobii]